MGASGKGPAAATRPASLDDVLGAASPAERVVDLCVAGKLLAEYQQAEAALAAARQRDAARTTMGAEAEAPAAARRVQQLEQRMRSATFTFRFRALADKEWSDLLAAHPAREGRREAFNAETFPAAAVAACCVEPTGLDTPDGVGRLFATLNAAQRAQLFEAAWAVNTGTVDVPFSAGASAVLRASAPSSTTAAREGSPAASS